VFEQIESVKRILEPAVPDGDSSRICGLTLRCVRYKLGQVKKLNSVEAKTYDLLLKNKLNPKTVYEWFLVENAPPYIKEKLSQGKMGLRTARAQYVQWKRMSNTRSGKEIMDEMKNIVRRLRWKSQEGLHKQF